MTQHPTESVSAIHAAISSYLKMAPWRDGGAGKGCQLSPDDGEEEGGQEDGFQISSDTESHHSHGDPNDLHDVESDFSQSRDCEEFV